ncbi:hypothetical protein [Burkholderia metallica]
MRFDAMRTRGPGGQHVKKTRAAMRATHVTTGLSVRLLRPRRRSRHGSHGFPGRPVAWTRNRFRCAAVRRAGCTALPRTGWPPSAPHPFCAGKDA